MIVPCNTNVTVSMKFGGTAFNISSKAYNLGTILSSSNTTCYGGFATAPSPIGEQNLLDLSNHEPHVQQDSG
jgi:hypothetical protein